MKIQRSGWLAQLLWFVLLSVFAPSTTHAATLPAGFSETLVAQGLSAPTAMQFAPDGRLFVCEQGGRLRVIENGALLTTPFLTVTVSSAGERGLLGVAFDPNFAANQFVYVYYTATAPTVHNRISRFVGKRHDDQRTAVARRHGNGDRQRRPTDDPQRARRGEQQDLFRRDHTTVRVLDLAIKRGNLRGSA